MAGNEIDYEALAADRRCTAALGHYPGPVIIAVFRRRLREGVTFISAWEPR
jgi:hypothetical protein